jgi:hypothetical protein
MEKINWIKDKIIAMPRHKQAALAICVVALVLIAVCS